MEEGELKEALTYSIANHMKKSYLNWNRETVEDEIIFEHLRELSGGTINLKNKEEDLSEASNLLRGNKKFKSSTPVKKTNRNTRGRKRH